MRSSPVRCRKRGPRSLASRVRRFRRLECVHTKNLLHGGVVISDDSLTSGQSAPDKVEASLVCSFPNGNICPSSNIPEPQSSSSFVNVPDTSSSFSFLHLNIRGWRSHVDELRGYLDLLEAKPKVIAVNDTFLNQSVSVDLPGYKVVGRRDRFSTNVNAHVDNLQSWGGILLLVACELDGSVVEVLSSDTAERMWFILHCDVGPVLLCVWYRPPSPGDISAISTFESEFHLLRDDVIGTIVMGDLNCHHTHWLRFSSHVSTEGRCLQRCCVANGLHQVVKQATRGEHMLDLVLTDLVEAVSTQVLPPISDHHCVLTTFSVVLEAHAVAPRVVWNYRSADWSAISEFLASVDFSFIDTESVDLSAQRFTDILLSTCNTFISSRTLNAEVFSHPWITARCVNAIKEKHNALGTDDYENKCKACTVVLKKEFDKYALDMQNRLRHLRRGSKHF